jgi:hypothetical protein
LPALIGAATIQPVCGSYASFCLPEAIARIFGTVNPLRVVGVSNDAGQFLFEDAAISLLSGKPSLQMTGPRA